MAENEIRVVITGVASDLRRALDGAKGDLGGLKAAIKEIPNTVKVDVQAQTSVALARVKELRAAAKDVPKRIDITASADTGVAMARLRLLERQARDTEEAIARAQLGSLLSGAGGAGGGASSSMLGIPGGAAPGAAQAIVGGSPAIVAGAGALTAVAGSAGAGLLGAGALGTGLAGILGVGGGSMLAVIKGASGDITKMQTAYEHLLQVQLAYGANSKQAAQAQANINAQVAMGSPLLLTIAKTLHDLGDQWQTVSQPALQALYHVMIPGLQVVKDLMPTVAGIAKTSFQAIGSALTPIFQGLSSPAFKKVLTDLGDAFAKLAPPLIQGFANLMRAFFSVAIAAAPFVIQIAQAFERWTASFAKSLAPGKALNDMIGGLVGQLRSWWDLATALGSVMVTIFSAGAGQGQGLVDTLTGIVRQFDKWLNSKPGQDAMKTFFRDSKDLVVNLFDAVGPLVGAIVKLVVDLMPTFTLVLKALKPALDAIAWAVSGVADMLRTSLVVQIAAVSVLLLAGGPIILGLVLVGFTLSHLKDIVEALSDAWATAWHWIKTAFDNALITILGGFSTLLGVLKSMFDALNVNLPFVGRLFGTMGDQVSRALGSAQKSIDAFRRTLDPTTQAAKSANEQTADSYEKLAARVATAVGSLGPLVARDIGKVDTAMVNELNRLGIKPDAKTLQGLSTPAGQPGAFPSLKPGSQSGLPKAGGGWIGSPGARGTDTVPIVVGAGEAILNHHQQGPVDFALQSTFGMGLGDLFQNVTRPHYMAGGGFAGNVPAMISEANRVDAKHFPYVWGGGHSGWTGGPFDCSGAVSDVLHAGGVLSAPRVSGDFMNYGDAGPGAVTLYANPTHVYMSIDGKYFGTSGSNPGGGAGWFPGAPQPGFAVRHVGPGGTGSPGGFSANAIKAPKWTGPGGLLGQVGRGAVAKATAGANQRLSSITAGLSSGTFGGGQPSVDGKGIGSGAWTAAARSIAQQHGWGAGELQAWWGVEQIEDPALSLTAKNPTSTAFGLAQGIDGPSWYAAHGGNASTITGQLTAMANYMQQRYGSPSGALAHEHAAGFYARGGFAPGGFATNLRRSTSTGRTPARFTAPKVHTRPASHPPKPHGVTHPRTPRIHVPAGISDSLKRLLPSDVVHLDTLAGGYAQHQVDLSDADTQLTSIQGRPPYPAQPLVTITDADAAAMQPAVYDQLRSLQRQLVNTTDPVAAASIQGQIDAVAQSAAYEAGDQIVNPSGMTVGRFFGPGGIGGGSWVPGISQRQGQIGAQLRNLSGQSSAVNSAGRIYGQAAEADQDAAAQRKARRARVLAFLRIQVAHAKAIQFELAAITTGNLKANVKRALSKQAIGRRLGDLRSNKTTVATELRAEKASQAKLIPLEQDPTHTQALQAQLDQINQSISVETLLGSGKAAGTAVAASRSAVLRNSMTNRLKAYATVDKNLGGSPYDVGTGGLAGRLLQQSDAIDSNRLAELGNQTALGPAKQTIKDAIAAYFIEMAGLGSLSNIQVRTPLGPTASAAAGATGPDLSALNALLSQQLAASQAALSLSQSQFGTFAGFAPLVSGRLLGSFATGIDRVPQTGPYLLHRDEMVIPDPYGPQGNRAAASVQTASGPVQIDLHFDGDSGTLVKLVDARMNQKALSIVSDHSGQRARLMSGVRRP